MTDEAIIGVIAGIASGAVSGSLAAWFRAKAEVKKTELKLQDAKEQRDRTESANRERTDRELISAALDLEQTLRKGTAGVVPAKRNALRKAIEKVPQDSLLRGKADELAGLVDTNNPDEIKRIMEATSP